MMTLILRKSFQLCVVLCVAFFAQVAAQNLPFSATGKPIDHSLRREVARTIDRGNQWLIDRQDTSGFWFDSNQPSTTAYALMALQRDPEEYHAALKKTVIENGYRYLNSCVQKNGGIYTQESRRLIDTPMTMLALSMRSHESQKETVQDARKFLAKELESMIAEKGGDKKRDDDSKLGSAAESGLLTMVHGLEALRFTLQFSEQSEDVFLKPSREMMLSFLGQHQYPVAGAEDVQLMDLQSLRGGFVAQSLMEPKKMATLKKGAEWPLPSGSYGFAGLLSYLYLDVGLEDERVEGIQDWLIRNYTLKQNPGLGQKEIYFYYLTMAKAWTALKIHRVPFGQASWEDWRHAMALRLMNLQQVDGSWSNRGGEALEESTVLSTSYALIALEMIYPGL